MLAVASAASFGWLPTTRKTLDLILELLPRKAFGDAKGQPGDKITQETPRRCFSWFALRLLSLWSLGRIPDGLPHHPYPAPEYDALLPHWDTDDLPLLTELLLAVCDRHTHEAIYSRSSAPSKDVDFLSDPYMAWPVEVHMLFRLRDSLGLPNPLDLDHPLMKTPLAVYTPEAWPMPQDDLLERITARALREYPELAELL
jgi:hypothetical protein